MNFISKAKELDDNCPAREVVLRRFFFFLFLFLFFDIAMLDVFQETSSRVIEFATARMWF